MFMSQFPRIPFALSLAPGPEPERPISNADFLDGYLKLGVWLRVLPAHQQLQTLKAPNATNLMCLCASAAFFEQMGMFCEDAVCTLVAWTVWAQNPNIGLADLLNVCNVKRERGVKDRSGSYLDDLRAKFRRGTGRVNVDPLPFLGALAALPDAEVLRQLGILWTRQPLVQMAAPKLRHEWESLPKVVRDLLTILADPKGSLLTSCFNKIKHGPQVGHMDMRQVALERRRHDSRQKHRFPTGPHLRILLHGTRTQERQEEVAAGERVAPFLVHHPHCVEELFFGVILHSALALSLLGGWLYRLAFQAEPPSLDPMTLSIVSAGYSRARAQAAPNEPQ